MLNKTLTLGFHYHVPVLHEKGQYKLPGPIGRFIDSLANECAKIIIFAHHPLSSHLPLLDYTLQHQNIHVINIGPLASHPYRILHSSIAEQAVLAYSGQLDALLLRGPSELLPNLATSAHKNRLPTVLLLVGDYLQGINDLPQPFWRKELIRLWAHWNAKRQLKVAQYSLVFVNSHKLYEQLQPLVPHLHETRTTTLNAEDFFERDDTCQKRPVRLLYTGRMDRAKGLFEMVEAVALLTQQDIDVVLDFVGWPQKGDTVLDELAARAQEYGISERIHYHGYKPVGPELFAYYRQADIYVLASQSSEGFPRTIWEAMAHSLPVVATRVGSIPFYLEHQRNAWLIEPRNAASLAEGISQIIENQEIRRRLIKNGAQLAQENTLERRAAEMCQLIAEWVAKNR